MSSDSDRDEDRHDDEQEEEQKHTSGARRHDNAAVAAAAEQPQSSEEEEEDDEPAQHSDAAESDDGEAADDNEDPAADAAADLPVLPDLTFRPASASAASSSPPAANLPLPLSAPASANFFASAVSLTKALGWWSHEHLFGAAISTAATMDTAAGMSRAARRKAAAAERQAKRQRTAADASDIADESDADSAAASLPRVSDSARCLSLPAVASYALHASIGFESDVSLSSDDDDESMSGTRRLAVSGKDITMIDGALRPPPVIPRAHTNRVSIGQLLCPAAVRDAPNWQHRAFDQCANLLFV